MVVASSYSAWRFPHPVDSRLRGNDGPGIFRIGTMRCVVLWIQGQVQNDRLDALCGALTLMHRMGSVSGM